MSRRLRQLCALLMAGVFVWLFSAPLAHALDVPPKPTDIPIVDQTNTLTTDQKQSLAQRIAAERDKSSNQIAILMIPTLQGDSLEEYSILAARQWGVGVKEKNNGVLLLVVKNDRVLRIEVGYGLEGSLTDALSSRIIRDKITPRFKEGNYYQGISDGLDSIILAIHNEYKADQSSGIPSGFFKNNDIVEFVFFGLFIVPAWVGAILARSKSWWGGGVLGAIVGVIIGVIFGFIFAGILSIIFLFLIGLIFDKAVSNNYQKRKAAGLAPSWWAGGVSGKSSGGFGGFGGGGFGGGGSSGSW